MDQLQVVRSQIHEAYAHNNMDLAYRLEEVYQDLYQEQNQTLRHHHIAQER